MRIGGSGRFLPLLAERLHLLSSYYQLLALGLECLILRDHILALRPAHLPITLPYHESLNLSHYPLVLMSCPLSLPLLLLYIKRALAAPEHQLPILHA